MTAPTLADVRRIMQRSGRIEGLTVSWADRPRWIEYPTGLVGYRGRVAVQAPGYRPAIMVVTRDERGTGVR